MKSPNQTLIVLLSAVALTSLCLNGCSRSNPSPVGPGANQVEEEKGTQDRETEGEGKERKGEYVKLTPEQTKNAGIELEQAGPTTVRERLPLYGVIAPNAERVREVAARFSGAIRSVTKRVGDPVKQGETLAVVESNESLQTYAVTAPLAGVVTARNANPGEQAGDKALFTIADLSTVWVELSLFPRDLAKVRLGQSVRVESADTALTANGKLIYLAPFSSTGNQTLIARVLIDNADGKWPPGLYVTAEVTVATTAVPLAVSREAVQTMEEGSVIFVQKGDGFEVKAVRLGRGDADVVEVLAGVEAGDVYATKNSFILKADLGKGEVEDDD